MPNDPGDADPQIGAAKKIAEAAEDYADAQRHKVADEAQRADLRRQREELDAAIARDDEDIHSQDDRERHDKAIIEDEERKLKPGQGGATPVPGPTPPPRPPRPQVG